MLSVWSAVGVVVLNAACGALVILGLPGVWLMLLCSVVLDRWVMHSGLFHPSTLIACTVLAALAELFEWVSSALFARRFGASRKSSMAAILGGIAGAVLGTMLIPVPLLGTLAGACAGAFLAAYATERSQGSKQRNSVEVGAGAALGYAAGFAVKVSTAVVVWVVLAVAAFVD